MSPYIHAGKVTLNYMHGLVTLFQPQQAHPSFISTFIIDMSLRIATKVIRIISAIRKKLSHPLFSIVEMLPEAVEHIGFVLNPSRHSISEELYREIQLFKQNLDAALVDQENGTEFGHYCYYIL